MTLQLKFYKKARTSVSMGEYDWFLTYCDLTDPIGLKDNEGFSLSLPGSLVADDGSEQTYSIYNDAFYGNDWLTELHILGNLDFIGASAFARSSIKSIYFYTLNAPILSPSCFQEMTQEEFTIYVPAGTKQLVYNTPSFVQACGGEEQWDAMVQEGNYIVMAANKIKPLQLYGNTSLSHFTIDEDIESIGQMAFLGISNGVNPTQITVVNNEHISQQDTGLIYDKGLYYSHKTLDSIDSNITKLKPNSLYKNEKIVSVSQDGTNQVHINTPRIESLAFQNALLGTNIKLVIGPQVEYISPYAFEGMTITSIELEDTESKYFAIKTTPTEDVKVLYDVKTKTPVYVIFNNQEAVDAEGFTKLLTKFNHIPSKKFMGLKINGALRIPNNIQYIGRQAFAGLTITSTEQEEQKIILDSPDNTIMKITSLAFSEASNITTLECIGNNIIFDEFAFGIKASPTQAPDAVPGVSLLITDTHMSPNIVQIDQNSFIQAGDLNENIYSYISRIIFNNVSTEKKALYNNDKNWAFYLTHPNMTTNDTETEYVFDYDIANKSQYLIKYLGESSKFTLSGLTPYYPSIYIGKGAVVFDKNSIVTEIELVNSSTFNIVGVGSRAFQTSKIQTFKAPSTLKSLGEYALYSSTSLSDFDLSEVDNLNEKSTVETKKYNYSGSVIPRSCCYGCERLTKIKLPIDTVQLDDNCFAGCRRLRLITIPANVKRIEGYALSFGGDMQNAEFGSPFDPAVIEMQSMTPPAVANTTFLHTNYLKIRVPRGSLASYQQATNWTKLAERFLISSATTDIEKQQCIANRKQTIEWEEYDL